MINDRRRKDRRKVYSLDYFENDGVERRSHKNERRKTVPEKVRKIIDTSELLNWLKKGKSFLR